ncbi:MAG: hypothetical protein F6K41_20275 [Symploca sp. SIO3E6]|nr:hypothetical protein [Caldora sp. SIO3E6]
MQEGRRQEAGGRRQEAGGKKACVVSFFSVVNWLLISMPAALTIAGILAKESKKTGKEEIRKTFPIPNSQFPIPNSQFPIPNSQFPIPNSQFPIWQLNTYSFF